jgi:hypothetical protein
MSARHRALLGILLAAWPAYARSEARDPAAKPTAPDAPASVGGVPRGHWQGDDAEPLRLCLDVQDDSSLLITFHDGRLRNPVVVEASYDLARYQKEQASLVLTVRRIVTKEIGPCRRFWIHQDLTRYDGLGLSLRPGANLRLRLTFSCQSEVSRVELCFDPDRPAGAKQPALCQRLSSPGRSRCQPAPPTRLERILPL